PAHDAVAGYCLASLDRTSGEHAPLEQLPDLPEPLLGPERHRGRQARLLVGARSDVVAVAGPDREMAFEPEALLRLRPGPAHQARDPVAQAPQRVVDGPQG